MEGENPNWRFRRPPSRQRPSGCERPSYGLPLGIIARAAYAAARHRHRSVWRDATTLAAQMTPPPVVSGIEHVPQMGPCVIIPNHYERPDDVWVGWGGIVIAAALAHHRPQTPPMHWVMTTTWQDCYVGPRRVPPRYLHWVLRALASVYGLVLMPASDDEVFGRGTALRDLFHILDDPRGQVVGLHPEAGGFETMITPPRGAGRVLGAIDRRQIPLIPTGVFEDHDDRLTVRFGPPLPIGLLFGLSDEAAAETAMLAIARLVPPETRGVYAERLAEREVPLETATAVAV